MSHATRRGISDHALIETYETAYKRLAAMGLDPANRDRVSVVIAMMLADDRCTPLDALQAANRIFPLLKEAGDAAVEGHA